VLLTLFSLLAVGCAASSLEQPAYYGARGAVRGTVDQLEQLKGDDKINAAAHDLAQAVVTGAGDGASKLEIDHQIGVLIETVFQVAKAQGNELVTSVIEQQGPRLQQLARQTLTGTIQGAGDQLKKTAETDITQATGSVVTSAVDAFATALASDKVGALKKDLIQTSGALTENASAGAVRGLRDELGKPETLDVFGALAKRMVADATTGAKQSIETGAGTHTLEIALGGFLVLTLAALVFYVRKTIITGRALTLVAQQINKGGHVELKNAIRAKAEQKKMESFLSMFLLDRGL